MSVRSETSNSPTWRATPIAVFTIMVYDCSRSIIGRRPLPVAVIVATRRPSRAPARLG